MMSRIVSCVVALMLLLVAAPTAAQRSNSDRDLVNRPHSGGLCTEDRKRLDELKEGERPAERVQLLDEAADVQVRIESEETVPRAPKT